MVVSTQVASRINISPKPEYEDTSKKTSPIFVLKSNQIDPSLATSAPPEMSALESYHPKEQPNVFQMLPMFSFRTPCEYSASSMKGRNPNRALSDLRQDTVSSYRRKDGSLTRS